MRTHSSFFAGLTFPVRSLWPFSITNFGPSLILAMLATIAVPALVRANVINVVVQRDAEAVALSDNGIGTPGPRTTVENVSYGLGEFSGSVHAFQAENLNPSGPDKVSVAEANLDYISDASSNRFSATLSQNVFAGVNVAGAIAQAQFSFFYWAQFEVTEATGFHALTSYGADRNPFGNNLSLQNRSLGQWVFDDLYDAVDFTGVLQPGSYRLEYTAYTNLVYHQIGSVTGSSEADSFLFELNPSPDHPSTVPDTASTLALLGFGIAGLISTAKLRALRTVPRF